MRCVFINIRCKPGTSYKVAEEIALREFLPSFTRLPGHSIC